MLPKSILIVDDDPGHLQLMHLALKHLNYPIMTAPDVQEALRILHEETPALILSDVAMPGISGEELLRAVKSNPRLAAAKVIFVTAIPLDISEEVASLVEQVLPKPFDLQKLEDAVLAALSDASTSP